MLQAIAGTLLGGAYLTGYVSALLINHIEITADAAIFGVATAVVFTSLITMFVALVHPTGD